MDERSAKSVEAEDVLLSAGERWLEARAKGDRANMQKIEAEIRQAESDLAKEVPYA